MCQAYINDELKDTSRLHNFLFNCWTVDLEFLKLFFSRIIQDIGRKCSQGLSIRELPADNERLRSKYYSHVA
jgi:hypothetical protein